MLLDMTEYNGLENIICEPTRGVNVLDLFFVNNSNKFVMKENIVNSRISDHNIIIISGMKVTDKSEREVKGNNYTNKIYEYVIDWESDECSKFYDGIMSAAGEIDLENDNED